jgi:hypothetical protein
MKFISFPPPPTYPKKNELEFGTHIQELELEKRGEKKSYIR